MSIRFLHRIGGAPELYSRWSCPNSALLAGHILRISAALRNFGDKRLTWQLLLLPIVVAEVGQQHVKFAVCSGALSGPPS